jgi:predicted amidohydrolase YtcJ
VCILCPTPTRHTHLGPTASHRRPDRRFLAATPRAASGRARTPAPHADLIIDHAKIITLDRKKPHADAIAIAGEDILAVGSRGDVERFRTPETKIIDAGGRTIIPGLNDSHVHFIRGGLTYSQELRWDGVPSLADGLRMLRAQALRTPAPHWVMVVGGWTAGQFAERRLPTLDEINAATGDVPCFILHLYDRAFLNKAALRVLGYNRETQDPFGGWLERDAGGQPTGLVVNTTSIGSLAGLFARVPHLQESDQILSTRHFMREMNRFGITSVVDPGGAGQSYPEGYQAIDRLAAMRHLTLRIGYSLFAQRPGQEIEDFRDWTAQVKPGDGYDHFRLVGAGEYVIWAAVDPANFAKEIIPPPPGTEERLTDAIKLIAAQGWPFRLHADYDVTIRRMLNALEAAHREVPLDKLRWVFDHAETVSPDSLDRIAALGGGIAIQNRMTLDGDAFAATWGTEAAADAPPIGRIRELGLPLACGTDGTRATSYNPWVALQWLVTGKTISGAKLNADRNLVDRIEALRLYTEAGASLTGEATRKGTLEAGKWADLAILSDDYLAVPDDAISRITSLFTMVGGEIVHGAEGFSALAPPPIPVTPDWLPIGTYGGYHRHGNGAAHVGGASHTAGHGTRHPHLPCLCGLI